MPNPYKRKRSWSSPGSSKRRFKVKSRRPTRRWMAAYGRKHRGLRRSTIRSARSARMAGQSSLKGQSWPKKLLHAFTYRLADTLVVPTTGDLITNSVDLNNPANPDSSSGQPRLWDQLMETSLYGKCACYRTDVEIIFHNQSESLEAMAWVRAAPGNGSAVPTPAGGTSGDVFSSGEMPHTWTRQIDTQSAGGPLGVVRYKATYGVAKNLGVPKGTIYTDPYVCQSSSSPTNRLGLKFGVSGKPQHSGSEAAFNVDYEVYLKFHCVLFDNLDDVPVSTSS